jgi:hypothetical protein
VVPPCEEVDDEDNDAALDDEDEEDEDDAPPAPREPPTGFTISTSPPTLAALAFSKQAAADADALIGKSILFHWPVIGWYAGVLQRRCTDGRIKRSGEQCNFYIYYEVDDDEVPTALRLEEYDIDDEGGWVLLEAAAVVAAPRAAAAPAVAVEAAGMTEAPAEPPLTLAEAAEAAAQEAGAPPLEAGDAANIVQTQAEYVAEAWRRGEEEGFETVHQLAEAQTDLATVRDAMEATDEALAQKEQEAAYMVDGEM